LARAAEEPEDPYAWRGQVVRKHIDDPDPGDDDLARQAWPGLS
jgi:hypothetical protein